MAEDVLPTVEDPSPLLGVQLVDEVRGEVLVGVLVPGDTSQTSRLEAAP